MAVPVVENTAGHTNNSSAASQTIAKPSGTASGDLLVAIIALGNSTDFTVTQPSGWTEIASLRDGAGSPATRLTLSYKVAGGSEPSSYTFNFSGTTRSVSNIIRISGVDTTTPINVSASANSGASLASSFDAPSVTTTVADCLLLCAASTRNAQALTVPSGMTEVWNGSPDLTGSLQRTDAAIASESVASAGATGTRAFTTGVNDHAAMITVAIAPAGGGGGSSGSATATDGAIEVSGSVGAASATANVSASATAGAAEIEGSAGTAAATANVAVSAVAGSLEAEGSQGVASATAGVSGYATSGAVEIDGETGSASVTANVSASAVAGSIEADGSQGSASATAHVSAVAVAGDIEIAGSSGVARVDSGSPEAYAEAGVIHLFGSDASASASGQGRGAFIPARRRPRFEVVFYTTEEADDLPDEGPIKPTPAKKKQIKRDILANVIDPFAPPAVKAEVGELVEKRLARPVNGKLAFFAELLALQEEAKRRADELEREIEEEDLMILSWAA